MKKLELINLGINFFKHCYEPQYKITKQVEYKYRGEIRTRTEYDYTPLYWETMKTLETHKVFTCPYCHQKKSFVELEHWTGDNKVNNFLKNRVTCSECYEEEMGEDL